MFAVLTSRIHAAGWSMCLEQHRSEPGWTAYVHAYVDPDAIRAPMFRGEGPTPELALSNAEAKAIAACALEAA